MAADAPKTRELNYLMVQHMGYAPETRALRHLRAGQRRTRFTLEDGRQIRDKGERFDEVTFEDVLKNHEILLNGVRTGAIRVCRPDNLESLTLAQFGDLLKRLAVDYKNDLKINETLLEPLVDSDLKDEKVWVEKPKEALVGKTAVAPAPQPAMGTGLLDDKGKEAETSETSKESEKKDTKKDKHSPKKDRR